jgi:hypothetical protein
VTKARKVKMVLLEHKVLKEMLGPKEKLVLKAPLVPRALLVLLVLLVLKAT